MPLAQTLIDDAFAEIGVIIEGGTPSSADRDRGLRILNRDIMEPWSAQKLFATRRVITSGTFLAATQTRSVGPSGNYNLTPRPTEIVGANRVDANGYRYPLAVLPFEAYLELADPDFQSTDITRLYYDPAVATGTLYAWPVPAANQTVEIQTLAGVSQFADLASTNLNLPPLYERAICETLKELFCRAWHRPMPEGLKESARKARADIQALNAAFYRRKTATDAPSTMSEPVGSDIEAFRTRQF